jgi:hypothetical protein
MMCDYGCIPDGVLSHQEFVRVMMDIYRLSAEITGKERPLPAWLR